MKLDHRIVVRALHFGALPEVVMNSRMLAIVPTTYARNAQPRYGFKVWALPYAPSYDVRLIWHANTASDPRCNGCGRWCTGCSRNPSAQRAWKRVDCAV